MAGEALVILYVDSFVGQSDDAPDQHVVTEHVLPAAAPWRQAQASQELSARIRARLESLVLEPERVHPPRGRMVMALTQADTEAALCVDPARVAVGAPTRLGQAPGAKLRTKEREAEKIPSRERE